MKLLRPFGFIAIAASLCSIAFAVVAPGTGRSAPVPVPAGQNVLLPAPGLFGRDLGLFADSGDQAGNTESKAPTSAIPTRAELGCVVNDADGDPASGLKLTDPASFLISPVTVEGRQMRALLKVSNYTDGSTLRCTGPAATSSQPMYLLAGYGSQRVVMRVFFGVAALILLVLGVVALAVARGISRRRARA